VLDEARCHDLARRPGADHDCIEVFPGHAARRYPGFRADQTDQLTAFALRYFGYR
jgi:hypothetical protein